MKTKTILFLIIILAALLLLYLFIQPGIVRLNSVQSGTAVFKYDSADISTPISDRDLSLLREMFHGKLITKDNPSCGFSEDVCIILDDKMTFCFACDACPIVCWKERERYFRITEEEQAELYALLKNYGFHFPCL